MSQSLDAAATAAVTSTARGAQVLADLEFAFSPLYFTTNVVDVVANGHTYVGKGDLFDVSLIGESENSGDEKITLGLSIVNSALIAASSGSVSNYRGKRVRLWLQFIDSTFKPAGAPILFWQGFMEPVAIERKAGDGQSTGRISLPCRRAGMNVARRADGLRLSDAQQQATYAGDKGYEFLASLIDKQTPITTKAFQQSAPQ